MFKIESILTKKEFFGVNILALKKILIITGALAGGFFVCSLILIMINAGVAGIDGAWNVTKNFFSFAVVAVFAYAVFVAAALVLSGLSVPYMARLDANFFKEAAMEFGDPEITVTGADGVKRIYLWDNVRYLTRSKKYLVYRFTDGTIIVKRCLLAPEHETEMETALEKALYRKVKAENNRTNNE